MVVIDMLQMITVARNGMTLATRCEKTKIKWIEMNSTVIFSCWSTLGFEFFEVRSNLRRARKRRIKSKQEAKAKFSELVGHFMNRAAVRQRMQLTCHGSCAFPKLGATLS